MLSKHTISRLAPVTPAGTIMIIMIIDKLFNPTIVERLRASTQ